jgi:hypothetical protein
MGRIDERLDDGKSVLVVTRNVQRIQRRPFEPGPPPVVPDRSERCPLSIGIRTLASDEDAIGTFLATVNLTAPPRG